MVYLCDISPTFVCLSCVFMSRYIKDINVKNSAEDLNALINKFAPEIKTWTPKPGAVLDLSLALRDSTSRSVCVLHITFITCVSIRPVFTLIKHATKAKHDPHLVKQGI